MSNVLTPRVTEIPTPRPADTVAEGEMPERALKMQPYNRARSQRDWVRLSLSLDGAYADYHGDDRNRRV